MERILVVGADTMVGARMIDQWTHAEASGATVFDVTGLSRNGLPMGDSSFGPKEVAGTESIRKFLADRQICRVVLCGGAGDSPWSSEAAPTDGDVQIGHRWIDACQVAGINVTLISSDAVFSGPWMFHAENSTSFCPSTEADRLRTLETHMHFACPNGLVLRTHAFGWHHEGGWIENLLHAIETGGSFEIDCVRHASPILVNDLIDVISKAWKAGLDGIYHVAGAERVSGVQFVNRLADAFHLELCPTTPKLSLVAKAVGFGQGETSLQTRKIRRALNTPMPMLNEGLYRLYEQKIHGTPARLDAIAMAVPG